MRSRTLFRAAVSAAAVGLAAFGTVTAQQPPTGKLPPAGQPATTVRPFGEWSPTPAPPGGFTPKQSGVQPAGGVLPTPPGYLQSSQAGNKGRLTTPVMAGADGVRPASGFDLPPPNLNIPNFKGGTAPSTAEPNLTKFGPLPTTDDPKPPVPVVPPVGRAPATPPVVPTPVALPAPPLVPPVAAPVTPLPIPAPAALPPVGQAAPVVPPAPAVVPPVATPLVPPIGAAPTAPPITPVAPPATNPAFTPRPTPAVAVPPAAAPVATPAAALPPRATPSVVVETVCPESVSFGQEYQYKLIVRNGGSGAVAHVRVENELPGGARFVGCEPQGELNGDRLVWSLGSLDAGAERHFTVKVKAGDEGEARTRATVTFSAAVSGRTHVTRPRLTTTVRGPESARAGDDARFVINVTNSGSGPANRVLVQATLSDGLYHAQAQKGGLIEAELPMVKAGETRTVELKLGAAKSGLQSLQIVTAADGSPDATAKAAMNVIEPMLAVRQAGPGKCLVGGTDPTFEIELTNPGTAATDPVQLHSVLPDGFDFASASDGGAVATGNARTVSWRLPGLPAGGNKKVTLRLRATTATDGSPLRTVAQSVPGEVTPAGATASGVAVRPAGRGLEARTESVIVAEGVAAVRFDVTVLENPVMVGREATYEIKVSNRGTGPCQNVQLVAVLADGTEFMGATAGATNQAAAVRAQGQQVTFEVIPSLGARADHVYRVRVKANAAGALPFRVQLSSDQLRAPLVKEESTTFYMEQR
ncbi:DUF11 domain-containing protein [Urbifossiella limnaea]|uniref:Large cysteine-rich periplasmic protein OmcB n=1 Tax=Urbifossiella limnaea TaxID=2528023 RepID=A0A517XT18_9BACT|nr:DUF11 domain-containing protein [Urbifossiella limnaea]QDU20633.1 Large cysteine-rich periplasmic protein OmcB precursor [Urbifossiella limnaea]